MGRTLITTAQTLALSNLQFQKVIVVNGRAYSTLATAYTAADSVATASYPVAMVVGAGRAVDFGDLTLGANWNAHVSIVGISPGVSKLGSITVTGYSAAISMQGVALNGVTGAVTLKARNCLITGSVAMLNGGSVFQDCNFSAAISDLASNEAQFINCLFAPSSGAPIDSSTEKSVYCFNCLLNAEVGANVTLNGSATTKGDLILP